jgi:cob(I)alamin adenosyltransferase
MDQAGHQEGGFLMVYTGNGKGKTSAALGMALRAVGAGKKVYFLQFMKGTWHYSELEAIGRLAPELTFERAGAGFCRIMDDRKTPEEHRQAALTGLELAREKMASGEYFLVVLDELNVAYMENLVTWAEVAAVIDGKAPQTHLLITGRGAPEELLARADLVTEMREIKHPFRQGLLARKGIDF